MKSVNFIVRLTEQCNLDCTYCYVSRESRRSSRSQCEIDDIKRLYTLVADSGVRRVELVWHGGEPLVFGKTKFREILGAQSDVFVAKDVVVHNALQTNGVLIDTEWCALFKEFGISVGISIDAPPDIHKELRPHWSGRSSYDRAIRGVSLLKESGVPVSAISVLNRRNVMRIREVFDFFQDLAIPFKLNPCASAEAVDQQRIETLAVSPLEYGRALVELFDLYVSEEELTTSVLDLKDMAASLFSGCNANCLFAGKCEDFFGMAVDGRVYFCDLFHVPAYEVGHVRSGTLSSFRASQAMQSVLRRQSQLRGCHNCQWWSVCRGGCASSSYAAFGDIDREDYYCESRKAVFSHMKRALGSLATVGGADLVSSATGPAEETRSSVE